MMGIQIYTCTRQSPAWLNQDAIEEAIHGRYPEARVDFYPSHAQHTVRAFIGGRGTRELSEEIHELIKEWL